MLLRVLVVAAKGKYQCGASSIYVAYEIVSQRRRTRKERPVSSLSAYDRFALSLLIVFLMVFIALGIDPWFRSDWLLENLIVFFAVPALMLLHRHMPLSKISYSVIFVFLCLHEVGAHYTYAMVPYDQWFETLTGKGLNERLGWDRNHYDRVIHLF